MSLSILNNIASLTAENQLTKTTSALQKTLTALSSGSRINSGADDAAGLAIADGLEANITALDQSSQNSTDGVGKLQVADGALSEVTSLLNRAVTLATEASTGTVSDTQREALDAEFTQIKAEITRIGTDTTFNGDKVFKNYSYTGDNATNLTSSTTLTSGDFEISGLADEYSSVEVSSSGSTALTATTANTATLSFDGSDYTGSTIGDLIDNINADTSSTNVTAILKDGNIQLVSTANEALAVTVSDTASTASLTAGTASTDQTSVEYNMDSTDTVGDLINEINADSSFTNVRASLTDGKLTLTPTDGNAGLAVNDGGVTGANYTLSVDGGDVSVYLSDGSTSSSITTTIGAISAASLGLDDLTLAGTDGTNAQTALDAINEAVSSVASQRGTIGAGVNRLDSASSVMGVQVENLTSAEDGIEAADVSQEVTKLNQYNVLSQTGISALSQANQMQQLVLKLLQ